MYFLLDTNLSMRLLECLDVMIYNGERMLKVAVLSLVSLLCCAVPLCGVDSWSTFSDKNFAYSVEYPSTWQVSSDPATGYFTVSSQVDKASLANTFSVEVEELSEADKNLDFFDYMDKGNRELKQKLEKLGHKNFKLIKSVADTLQGNVVHRITFKSSQFGNLMRMATLVRIRHEGRHFMLTCAGEEGYYYNLASADFERMIESFSFAARSSEYLENYMRVRGDLSGAESVYHWKGKAYGVIPGEKRKELFALEGYSIIRTVPKADGYYLLSREVALILDHRTDQVLDTWRNPLTGKDVPVLHIFNDPVNSDFGFTAENLTVLPMILPSSDLGEDIAFYSEYFPFYPNPLPRKEYPLNAQSDTYQASEFIQYIAEKADIANASLKSVPATYSFTRIYPWLPFMQMGDRPGNVVVFGRGRKLEGGFSALPKYLRDYVMTNKPDFATAPKVYTQPNETIWTYFKKQAELLKAQTPEIPEP